MSTTPLPLSLRALERANEVRLGRSQIKRDIAAGKLTFAQLLDDVPACCAQIPAHKALTWLPGVGSYRARRISRDDDGEIISETLPLCAIGASTRQRLLAQVEAKVGSL
jgi:hypothetical protein